MLKVKDLPGYFWVEVVCITAFLVNIILTKVIERKTLKEA